MILPHNDHAKTRVIERWANEVMSIETCDILKRLIRAQLSLVQAQEFIRIRLNKQVYNDGWNIFEVYQLIDR